MPEIRVTPLGAGQDVGRSCILVSIAGKNVMLDCGMHMGFSDDVSLKGGRPGIQPAPRRHHRGTWASESQALTMEEERGQVGTGRRAAPTVTQQVEHLGQTPDFCPTCSGVLSSRWPQWACRVWVSGSTAS
uniref:Integrator complex subunit 11 n=1 Tax=Ovis aries TaxID=9940 RepID=A0AC11D338_SHEEP